MVLQKVARNGIQVNTYSFNKQWRYEVSVEDKWKDRPVVYLINNKSEIYIWETNNATNRFWQHLDNPARKWLKWVNIIFDDTFNKSAILDIEQSLIQYFNADNKFIIQNLNSWQSSKHNYYQREKYINKLEDIRGCLKSLKLAYQDFYTLKNSSLFKYSPYIALTQEQYDVSCKIIKDIMENVDKWDEQEYGASIISWWAGTWKTILAINIIFNILNASRLEIDVAEDSEWFSEEQAVLHELKNFLNRRKKPLKIAFVLPMEAIRKTIAKVFYLTKNWLTSKIIKKPIDITKEKYDIVFVDEAHRLHQRKNLWWPWHFASFDKWCARLWLDKTISTELDWITTNSKYQVIFYDKNQTIRWSDISYDQFVKSFKNKTKKYELQNQIRCLWWNSYMEYIKHIFDGNQKIKQEINNYDLKLFDEYQLKDMIKQINDKNLQHKLCRVVAWFSWERKTKNKTPEEIKSQWLYDIWIEWLKLVRNLYGKEYILRDSSINEIWCVHTTQWFDLNYVWIIFGREIDYNRNTWMIEVDLSKFCDTNAKKATDKNIVKQYIINAYKVMMTRWIKWCYVYACNKWLRDYLSEFMSKA